MIPLFELGQQRSPVPDIPGRKYPARGTDVPTGDYRVEPGTYGTNPLQNYPPPGTVYDPIRNQSVRQDMPGEPPSVYTDLDPTHVYIKDQIAGSVVKQRNIDYYFNKDNIGKTTDQLEQEEQGQREHNQQLAQLNSGLQQWMSVPPFDNSGLNQRYNDLRSMTGEMPGLPVRPSLDNPNTAQMLAAGLGAIFDPGHAFDILSTPLAYGLQSREQRYQDQLRQHEQAMQKWQINYGLSHEQAQVMAGRELAQYEATAKAMDQAISRDFEARKFNADSVNRWNEKVMDARNELTKLSIQQTTQLAHEALKSTLDPQSPPAMRAKAALFIQALTGKQYDAFLGETPQNQQVILENSLKDLELRFKQQDYPLQLQGRQLGNQHTFLENQALGINNRYLDEKNRKELQKLDADIGNVQSTTTDRDQRLRNYLSGGVNADRIQQGLRQWTESKQKLTEDLNKFNGRKEQLEQFFKAEAEKQVPGRGINIAWDRDKAVAEKAAQLATQNSEYQQIIKSIGSTDQSITEADQQIKHLNGAWDEVGKPTIDGSDLGAKYEGHSDYKWGASGAGGSFDCSSFTQCVYKDSGVKLPRTAQEQFDASEPVTPSNLRPGDLVFFHDNQSDRSVNVHHVGIFIGYDDRGRPMMRHASSAKDGVITVDLEKYSSGKRMQLLGIRRPKALAEGR